MLSFIRSINNLLGVGPYLLLAGFILEGLTIIVKRWIYFAINLDTSIQILLTLPCVIVCLLGLVWFNRSLNLIRVNFQNGKNRLITNGPFAYVRHPLYSVLIVTLPPLMVIWFADLLFLIPWILVIIVSHFIVSIEERGLIDTFGEDYKDYRKYVPALLPYKGTIGKRFRKD